MSAAESEVRAREPSAAVGGAPAAAGGAARASPIRSITQVFYYDVVAKGVLALVGLVLIRFMPAGDYARFTFAMALVVIATQTIASSFNRIYVVAHQRLNLARRGSAFLGLQLLILALVVAATLRWRGSLDGLYWLTVFLVLGNCLSDYSATTFQRRRRFRTYSRVLLVRALLFAGGVGLCLLLDRYEVRAGQILAAQAIAGVAVFVLWLGTRLDYRGLFRVGDLLQLVLSLVRGEYGWLLGYFFLLTVVVQADVLMLRALSTELSLATYGAAFRFYALLAMILNAGQVVLLPTIQQVRTLGEYEGIMSKYRRVLVLLVPAVLVCGALSKWFIPLIDRGRYPDAAAVFQVLTVSIVISLLFVPQVNLLFRFNDSRFLFFLQAAVLALNIGLNLALIPRFGALGAAFATLLSFAPANAAIAWRSRRFRRRLPSAPGEP